MNTLTRREREICVALMTGRVMAKEIGRLLDISPRTVEDHMLTARGKLGARTKTDLLRRLMGMPS